MRVHIHLKQPLYFERPLRVLRAYTAEQVEPALRAAQDACDDGLYCAGYLSYELGAVFASLPLRSERTLPLLVLGIYDEPQIAQPARSPAPYRMSGLRARITREAYDQALKQISRAIYEGDVYQVNYTVPFDFAFSGDPHGLFCDLLARSGVAHAAYVQDEELALVSLSPELFLETKGGIVTTMPMKGTASPEHRERLNDPKNRAEHLMIVDLLRNDLHRICSQVTVPELHSIERYPTFWTMTSTLRGQLREHATLGEILRATFPCGSITGAPKVAAMKAIQSLEAQPRGAYTGSIGYAGPNGESNWNVAIRTLQIDTSSARGRLDIGGGIVADSKAADEWNEIAIKRRFVARTETDFALLETFAAAAPPQVIDAHLARLAQSARHFGIPANIDSIRSAIAAVGNKPTTLLRLRLQWNGEHFLKTQGLDAPKGPVSVCIARRIVRSADPLLHHKTSWRNAFDEAYSAAVRAGCFDAIGTNERDELTEGTRTSLFLELDGTLYTPPLACGILPGILRATMLEQGRCTERVLYEDDLHRANALYVGNSARGLLRAELAKELTGV
jgi:para-aminobenzoate synthetase/4-amino-4-deoxychorismate lyase